MQVELENDIWLQYYNIKFLDNLEIIILTELHLNVNDKYSYLYGEFFLVI